MNPRYRAPLSPAGLARRDQILALAQESLSSRRRERLLARAAAATGFPALAILLAVFALRGGPTRTATPEAIVETTAAPGPAPLPAPSHLTVARIRTDAGILARARIVTSPLSSGVLIDDDQLQDLLRRAGRDPGLVRVGHRVVLSADLSAEAPREDPAVTPG